CELRFGWCLGFAVCRICCCVVATVTTLGWLVAHVVFFFSRRRRHTRCYREWSSDVCSSDLACTRSGSRGRGYSAGRGGRRRPTEIGRASCRERVEVAGGAGVWEEQKQRQTDRVSSDERERKSGGVLELSELYWTRHNCGRTI